MFYNTKVSDLTFFIKNQLKIDRRRIRSSVHSLFSLPKLVLADFAHETERRKIHQKQTTQ